DGDDVDAAVAVEVGAGEVFDGDAAGIDDGPGPFGAGAVGGFVNADAAAIAGFGVQIVADADDQLFVAVAVEVGAPDGVAPFQGVVEKMTLPELAGFARGRVGDDLVAVPRLNGGDVFVAASKGALFDFAGAAIALGIVLV